MDRWLGLGVIAEISALYMVLGEKIYALQNAVSEYLWLNRLGQRGWLILIILLMVVAWALVQGT